MRHGMCIQHLHSPALQAQLMNNEVSITPYTTNATSSSIPLAAATRVVATGTVIVDEDTREYLITRRTIRTPMIVHAEITKGAVPL